MKRNTLFQSLLLPFSWLYGLGVYLRNKQFDLGIRKQVVFEIPLIVIGNLSAGGTGKTPMTAFLLSRLLPSKKTGVLSRGYGRRTRGYLEVEMHSTVSDAGDEPKLIKQKFPDAKVAVSESRVLGVATMLHENPELELIILDDAFQHRQIAAGLPILLTEYAHPFSRDTLLPAGRLRETATGAKRAKGIVVTKCPVTLSDEERIQLTAELTKVQVQPVFFSYLKYGEPYHFADAAKKHLFDSHDEILLFCGIANPEPLVGFLEQVAARVHLLRFRDHHNYSIQDIKRISQNFQHLKEGKRVLLTTEKDAVRLQEHQALMNNEGWELYCIPVEIVFFEKDRVLFDNLIRAYIESTVYEPGEILN